METRANVALIGAFMVAMAFAGFGFVDWLSGSDRIVQYRTYELVFLGSVPGLSSGGAVQFNGLKVGEVTQLFFSEEDPSRVDALIDIDKRTPVKTNTRARLEQTLLGAPVVLLVGGTPGAPDIEVQPGQRYPRILTEKTVIQDLFATLERLSIVPKALEKTGDMLAAIAAAPEPWKWNIETFTNTFAENSRNIENVVRDARELDTSITKTTARLARLLADIDSKKLRIGGDGAGASANLELFSASRLSEYEQFAGGARKAVKRFDGAVRSLERDPQRAISGAAPASPE
jgi:phospholipid/cholesterol/gamma-HCH transport system substrate-binding protein